MKLLNTEPPHLSLGRCPDILTLLVGPEEDVLVCHKTFMCFYSETMYRFCFEVLQNIDHKFVKMKEENLVEIRTFIAWVYTGYIEGANFAEPERLVRTTNPATCGMSHKL